MGKSTSELQAPTGYSGIYATWDDEDVTGDGVNDSPWDFGTASQYPILQVDFNDDGTVTSEEFGTQRGVLPPTITMVRPAREQLTVVWYESLGFATGYDVRYILTSDDENVDANWIVLEDVWMPGSMLEYTITSLIDGYMYDVQVRTKYQEKISPWSDTVVGTPKTFVDHDADDDGLIEVSSLEQLNAIRYDLDGNGEVASSNRIAYALAFPDAVSGMGCPESGCAGYELTRDLDFNDPDSYTSGMVNTAWITGSGWEPIGIYTDLFAAIFHGGGHTISNLFIDRYDQVAGLFGVYSGGTIKNVGLVDANVSGRIAGGLVGNMYGAVEMSNCYVTGQVMSIGGIIQGQNNGAGGLVGSNAGEIRTSYARVSMGGEKAGGLVGSNSGTLSSCYATGSVSTSASAGGLIGRNTRYGSVVNCYTTARVSGISGSTDDDTGGFAGVMFTPHSTTTFSDNYWDTDATRQSRGDGTRRNTISLNSTLRADIMGKTASELRSPTGYSGIYATWNDEDVTGDGAADAPWDFGTSSQYPILKVDFDDDGMATSGEFGTQRVLSMPTGLSTVPGNQQFTVTWQKPYDTGNSAITAYDVRYISATDGESIDANWTVDENAWMGGSLEYNINLNFDDAIYAVQVRAENGEGTGPWSETILGYSSTSPLPSVWVNFVEAKWYGTVPILPDFSYAGYHRGTKPVPEVVPGVTHTEFSVTNYGAIPDDHISDQPAIQDAINAATDSYADTGMPSVVTFPSGEFLIFADSDRGENHRFSGLRVRSSYVVLKGSGSRDGGTIIRQVNIDVGDKPWRSNWALKFSSLTSSDERIITTVTENAERESYWLTVRDATSLSVGQWIRLTASVRGTDNINEYLSPYTIDDI